MRILISGGSGFIGRSLLDGIVNQEFLSDYKEILLTSRNCETKEDGLIKWAQWDVLDRCPLDPNFDLIIHAATSASAELNSNEPALMFDNIVSGAKNVIQFAAQHKRPPRVLFLSSGAIYGNLPENVQGFPEDWTGSFSPTSPKMAYAEGKRAAEFLFSVAMNNEKLIFLNARLFAFSGRFLPLDRHFAIGNFVRDVVEGEEIVIRGDGLTVRSYLDQDDMSKWLIEIAKKGIPGVSYHVGSERALNTRQLAELVSDRYQSFEKTKIPIRVLNLTSDLDGVSRYFPSTLFTRTSLNIKETVSLESSIDSMIQAAISKPSY